MKIAIIMTCYNRKDFSVRCVNSLMDACRKVPGLEPVFYIWDDGSTDGTADELEAIKAPTKVYRGEGGYFWSKSMNAVMSEALRDGHDLYLMVNDDVCFYKESVAIMLDSYWKSGGKCAVVGSSQFEGDYTYGGRDCSYEGIPPRGKLIRCVYADWNCFLVDRYVVESVGIICGKYEHAWGDYDYSARLNRRNIPQYIALDYVGECEDDHRIPSYFDPESNLKARMKSLFSPKGEPIYSFFRFHWVDKRVKGLIIATYSYFLLVFRVLFVKKR